MELHNYFRSSASYRVRIALGLKGLDFGYMPVHLQKNEQTAPAFAGLSANRLVPLLRNGDQVLTQSLAIIEYLDETHPEPPLLPGSALDRARIRALSLDIACEIHPLNNLRVLRFLTHDLALPDEAKTRWYRHWVETGFQAVERQLAAAPSTYCHGQTPTMADCALVPQVVNAQRFECPLDHLPHVMRVFGACMAIDAFRQAGPENCPDAA